MNSRIEELQGMLACRDRVFATLVHELRNPLAPIANAVEVLAKCGDERPGVSSARGIIQRQLRLLIRLVDDLSDVAQIVRGHVVLHKETVDLAEVVATAVETARPLIESREHELEVRVPRCALIVEADGVRLVQVAANLLINAAKYTRVGGRIEVSAERIGKASVIRVRDNGMGIERAMLERVFEPFTQGAPRSQAAQGGLGMGLAVARQLVELHGGAITVQSEGKDRGSEFAVLLPSRRCGRRRAQNEAVTKMRAPP